MRILLATDDSESARCAERWIIRLATARTPHVEVVSVAPSGLTRFGWAMRTDLADVGEAVEQVRLGQLRAAERIANDVGGRLQDAGLRVHTWARQGDTADELLAMIESDEPDLVVVGTRGQAALTELILGSVSRQLVRYSPQPVVVVRGVRDGSEPLPRRVLVVLSGGRGDARVCRWLAEAGIAERSEMVVAVSVADPRSEPSPAALVELDERMRVEHERHVRESIVPLVEHCSGVEHEARRGHALEEVLAATREHGSDLVVVGRPSARRGRRALGEELAHHAPCSVLVVPSP